MKTCHILTWALISALSAPVLQMVWFTSLVAHGCQAQPLTGCSLPNGLHAVDF